jgi:hypothetical protein
MLVDPEGDEGYEGTGVAVAVPEVVGVPVPFGDRVAVGVID